MNKLEEILFLLKKPKLIVVFGSNKERVRQSVFQILKPHFEIGREVFIVESDSEDFEKLEFLIRNSSLPVMITSQTEDDFFEKAEPLIKAMSGKGVLISDRISENIEKLKQESHIDFLTFGFEEKSDFYASDIRINGGINFKINYKGNSVPVWLEKTKGEEQMQDVLPAMAAGTIFGLNLVEISQSLKTPDKT